MDWQPMDSAPTDGTLVDLNFDGVRRIDCEFHRGSWSKEHGYPSMRTYWPKQIPSGWMPRPIGLVDPYESNPHGVKYVP